MKKLTLLLAIALGTVLTTASCTNRIAPRGEAHTTANPATHPLANGAYLVLQEAPTPQDIKAHNDQQRVLTYDRRKYSGAAVDEPLVYVAIDSADFIPMVIEGVPDMQKDAHGLRKLTISLSRQNAQRAETFTRSHLGGRVAMIVDGEIVTLHKIRTVVVDGKLQITRCTDNACEIIRSKLTQ